MRSNEQFKAYVYEKADSARAKNKRMHAAWARGAAAFSLLVVVGGAYLFANGNSTDMVMAPTVENAANKSAEMAVFDGATTVLEYASLADAVSVHDESGSLPATAAVREALPETVAVENNVQYAYTYTNTVTAASLTTDYTITESASEYSGDLTDIDFSKNVALTITAKTDVASWKITYGADCITVVLTAGEKGEAEIAYTILLEKEKYTGQEIKICYK